MKTLRLTLAAAVISAIAFLAPVPASAQGYQGLSCTVSDHLVTGGDDVTVEAEALPDNDDATWTLEYDGQSEDRSGNPVSATFETDEVDDPTQTTVTATVTLNGQSTECTGSIFLTPEDDDDDGDDDGDGDGDGDDDGGGGGDGDGGGLLPNTGGERLAWLIIGAMLVLVGGGVVVASRRRDA